jgi:hypothetical protein
MLRHFAAAAVVSSFAMAGWAQSPSAPPALTTPLPAKSATKKPAAKATPAARPVAAAESGPCSVGVISAIGERFSVQKFGFTAFQNERVE